MSLDLFAELSALIRALEEGGAEYALAGGLALAVHGAPRATTDIDLLVPPEALDTVGSIAARCGFIHPAAPIELGAAPVEVRRFTKVAPGAHLTLDLLVARGALRPIFASRMRAMADDLPLQVVSRDGLIAMKAMAGRAQDIADLERLRGRDDG